MHFASALCTNVYTVSNLLGVDGYFALQPAIPDIHLDFPDLFLSISVINVLLWLVSQGGGLEERAK